MKRINGEILGAIYDVDDTLLDNQPGDDPVSNLHQQSRLAAIHAVGAIHDIPELLAVTPKDNFGAFARSPVHTVSGALWVILQDKKLRGDNFDPHDPLIEEMLAIKNKAYAEMLVQHGRPHSGAIEFVRDLASHYSLGTTNAIASTATGDDIRTFLRMTQLTDLIPDDHIIAVENVEHPKPNPEAFDKAFRSLGLPESARSRVPAFEDDPRGMLSARKAGLIVCAITTRYSREFLEQVDAKPDFIADSFAEYRDVFHLPPLPQ